MRGHLFRHDHAVVIGGSVAGLLAARVLADRFTRVTIVERDALPAGPPQSRRGTPQDGHFHALMAAGLASIERLVPGFEADLAAAGAVPGDASLDAAYLLPAGWAPRFKSGLRFRGASRRLVEWTIRRHVAALPNVSIVQRTRVTGLAVDGAGAVRGVVTVHDRSPEPIDADFVVDASGRGSRAPDWLDAAGFGRAREAVVDSRLAYASQRFERPSPEPEWKALLVLADPMRNPRYGGIYPEEDGRWVVALAGIGQVTARGDTAGFLAFARALRSPLVHAAIANAKPLEPVLAFRNTGNRWRRYDQLARLPEGFVLLGDAVAAMNPIYGQGMTLAAFGAALLKSELDEGRPASGFSLRYQRRLARALRIPWLLATSQDLRHGSDVPPLGRLVRYYTDRLQSRIPADPTVARAFFRTLHLADPAAFLRPSILARAVTPFAGPPRDAMAETGVPVIVRSDE